MNVDGEWMVASVVFIIWWLMITNQQSTMDKNDYQWIVKDHEPAINYGVNDHSALLVMIIHQQPTWCTICVTY